MFDNEIVPEKLKSVLKGCSPYFITNSVLLWVNNKRNLKISKKNALADVEFQKELQRQKEVYEDQREAEEWAFKIWLRRKQREFTHIENSQRLENDRQKADLTMFFNDWPLQIAIETINNRRKENTGSMPINIVVGKHARGDAKDPISLSYASLVDEIIPVLKVLGIQESNIYRFKDQSKVYGGVALAYIYSMMSVFPTVVILPAVDERYGKFNISVGLWNQDSLFPLQNEVFSLDYDAYRISIDKEYFNNKIKEIKMSYIALASVMNDAYSLLEYGKCPIFPEYAIKKSIISSYPQIINFAITEFKSLLLNCQDTTRGNLLVEGSFFPYSHSFQERIEEILSGAIKTLES